MVGKPGRGTDEAAETTSSRVNGAAHDLLPYGRPLLDDEDRRAVLEILDGHWLTQGPMVERFEAALCERLGAARAVATSSGTAALHLAAICLGWEPGDVVIVPAVTFLASANCAAYVGAEPFFVDIDDETLCIDLNCAEQAIVELRAAGRRVRAIIGVDMAGHPCDWLALRDLADRFGLQLVDDACHALGATYGEGRYPIGSCAHCDVTILSFHPVKHITTGEGGAILTNDAELAEHARRLRSHGTIRGRGELPDWEGPWHYDMVELGYNYRLTDLQSSLGLSQLRKLDSFVARRRLLAVEYDGILGSVPGVRTPGQASGFFHSFHLYVVRIDFSGPGDRREFFRFCHGNGVQPQVHYRPVPLNSYYARQPGNAGIRDRIPVALKYYSEAVSLPLFPQLTSEQLRRVTDTVEAALGSRR